MQGEGEFVSNKGRRVAHPRIGTRLCMTRSNSRLAGRGPGRATLRGVEGCGLQPPSARKHSFPTRLRPRQRDQLPARIATPHLALIPALAPRCVARRGDSTAVGNSRSSGGVHAERIHDTSSSRELAGGAARGRKARGGSSARDHGEPHTQRAPRAGCAHIMRLPIQPLLAPPSAPLPASCHPPAASARPCTSPCIPGRRDLPGRG